MDVNFFKKQFFKSFVYYQAKSLSNMPKRENKKGKTNGKIKKISKPLIIGSVFLGVVIVILSIGYFSGWFEKSGTSSSPGPSKAPIGGKPSDSPTGSPTDSPTGSPTDSPTDTPTNEPVIATCTIDGCYPDFEGITVVPVDTDSQAEYYTSLLDPQSDVYAYSFSEPYYSNSFTRDNSYVYFASGNGSALESAYPSYNDLFKGYSTRHPQYASNFFCQFARSGAIGSSMSLLICQASTTNSKITPADLVFETGLETGGKLNSVIPLESIEPGISCEQLQTACDALKGI